MTALPWRRTAQASRRAGAPTPGESPDERAQRILCEHLTDEQRSTYLNERFVALTGSRGGEYCLHADFSEIAVFRTRGGEHDTQFCVHVAQRGVGPVGYYRDLTFYGPGVRRPGRMLPVGDHMLTYVMLLGTDELRFCRLATPHYVHTFCDHEGMVRRATEPRSFYLENCYVEGRLDAR